MDKIELIKLRGNHEKEELAELLNVSVDEITSWEDSGEITDTNYIKLKRLYEHDNGEKDYSLEAKKLSKRASWKAFLTLEFIFPVIFIIIFILLGVARGLWHPGWVVLTGIPLYYFLLFQISARKMLYCYGLFLLVVAYLAIGFLLDYWHPYWVIIILAVTYKDILRSISYKKWYFMNIFPLLIFAYVLISYYTNLWNILWLILIPIIPYQVLIGYLQLKRMRLLRK